MADAHADAGAAAPPKKGKKKLIIIIAAALLVVLLGGGAAVFMMKKKAADAAAAEAEGEDGETAAPAKHAKIDPSKPPVFVALDPFVVNLADKESDRFAQIAVTLQVDDPKFAEQMKSYMPAIRNNILMILAHKTSEQLLERSGKEELAKEIMREAVRPMGIEIAAEVSEEEAEEEDPKAKKKKKKKKAAEVHNPVVQVHFANFIVQ